MTIITTISEDVELFGSLDECQEALVFRHRPKGPADT